MRDVDQERGELAPAPLVAADREGAERVAVVALPPRDEVRALRLPDLDEVLARHLERGLDRLRAAAHEIGVARAGGAGADELVGERLGDLGREEARVHVREPVDLLVDRGEHVRVAVAQARDRGAAAGVEVAPALGIGHEHAFAADGDRGLAMQVAVQDAGHRTLAGGEASRLAERSQYARRPGAPGPPLAPARDERRFRLVR